MDTYNMLKKEIRRYIYDQKWHQFTKIQGHSIKLYSESEDNLILIAPTASGKTEAAFLPAINSIENWEEGIKIVYISPLIALTMMLFVLIYPPCLATLAVIKRETGSWKWVAFMFCYENAFAWIACFIFYNIGLALGF